MPWTEPVLPLRLMLGAAAPPTPPNTLLTDPLRDLVGGFFVVVVVGSVAGTPSASGAARGGSNSSETKLSTRETGRRDFCFSRRRCEGSDPVDWGCLDAVDEIAEVLPATSEEGRRGIRGASRIVEVEPVEEAREAERILVGMVESLGRADADEASAAKRTGSGGGGGDVVASCSSSIVDDADGAAVMVELRLLFLFPRVLIIPALTDLRTAGGSGGGGGDRAVDDGERIRSGVGAGAPAHSPATVAILAARFRRAP